MNWPEFTVIAIAHFLAVASPGPDFAIVLRQTLRFGNKTGIWTSAGVGAGIALHISYCLLGVAVLIKSSAEALTVLQIVAACLLLYLGVQSLRGARVIWRERKPRAGGDELSVAEVAVGSMAVHKAFLLGFMTNGLNPKATLFFLALFTVLIDPQTPLSAQLFYASYLVLATFLWFAGLSLFIDRESIRDRVRNAAPIVDAVMGFILIGLAVQLLIVEVF